GKLDGSAQEALKQIAIRLDQLEELPQEYELLRTHLNDLWKKTTEQALIIDNFPKKIEGITFHYEHLLSIANNRISNLEQSRITDLTAKIKLAAKPSVKK